MLYYVVVFNSIYVFYVNSNDSTWLCDLIVYYMIWYVVVWVYTIIVYAIMKSYGMATISRLPKIIGLFCRIPSLLQGSFAKETYHSKEPTNRSHPIL